MILNGEKTEVPVKDNVLVLFFLPEITHGLGRCLFRFSEHVVEVHFVVLFTQNEIIFYNTTYLKNTSLIPKK